MTGRVDLEREVRVERAAEETAVRYVPRPQKWTKRQILKHIRAWVKEHSSPPTLLEWNAPRGRGFPSSASVARAFGTFNEGIRAAGFEPRKHGGCDPARPDGRRIRPRQRRCARLTSDDLAAAFVLYARKGLSTSQLAELLWRKYDYPSPRSCRDSLLKGFRAEGFTIRTKSEARMALPREQRMAITNKARAARTIVLRGELNPRAKLTEGDVLAIRASVGTTASLARQFNVSEGTIAGIRKGRTWRHLAAA